MFDPKPADFAFDAKVVAGKEPGHVSFWPKPVRAKVYVIADGASGYAMIA